MKPKSQSFEDIPISLPGSRHDFARMYEALTQCSADLSETAALDAAEGLLPSCSVLLESVSVIEKDNEQDRGKAQRAFGRLRRAACKILESRGDNVEATRTQKLLDGIAFVYEKALLEQVRLHWSP